MSQPNETYNPFDPTGMWKEMRDSNMQAWSRMMIELVNTEAYAQSTGSMLDAWLGASGPFRRAVENAVTQSLTNVNLPVRDDVTRLAERLTNIEMRLDDIEAKLDQQLRSAARDKSGKDKDAKKESKPKKAEGKGKEQ